MHSAAAVLIVFALTVTSACAGSCGEDSRSTGGEGAASALFEAERVPKIDLVLEPSAMADLAREPRDFVRASFRVRGHGGRHEEVAVRFKGHRSMRDWSGKPAFKLDFDKYEKGRRIFGLSGLVLNNMVDDPTMLRENLASRVYAALSVPSPRASHAEVFVNGERFGLYALLEPVDELLLARAFGAGDGPLYEGEYGCDVYEDDVPGFQQQGGEDRGRKHLLALARAVSGQPSQWLFGAEREVALQPLLSFFAAAALLGDFDGYRHAHNYFLYRDPKAGLWSVLPWGFDRVFKKRLSIYDSNGRLARACFADADCRLEYVQTLHRAARAFEALELETALDQLEARIATAVERDPRKRGSRKTRAEAVADLRRFIRERPAEVRAQLACWDGASELDRDGDGAGCMDCDDADPAVRPGAQEVCDGEDNDCSGLIDDAPSCDCARVQADDATFALCDLPMPFWRAQAFCEARGQVLARVDDRDLGKQLERAARDIRQDAWWIGLDDLEREGRYRFHDGGSSKRSLWAKGEPDFHACGQDCAALKKKGGGRLRDLHCATRLPFICGERTSTSGAAELPVPRTPKP